MPFYTIINQKYFVKTYFHILVSMDYKPRHMLKFILPIFIFNSYIQSSIVQIHDRQIIIKGILKISKLCFPYIRRKSYSTKRDLAITSVLYRERNLALNLLSIRQSGCEATIVVLCDKTSIFSPKTKFMINELNVIVVQSNVQKYIKIHSDMTRTYFVVNYVKKNRGKYDRVFFFDSYDVFFETDPFQFFTEKKVYLFQESLVTINEDGFDRQWIVDCYGEKALEIVGDKLFVCAGTVGSGSIEEFIKLYTILDAENKWKVCRVDQGPLNYLLYSGKFKAKNLSYHVFNHTGPVLTLNLAIKIFVNIDGYLFVHNALNQTPAVLHQTKNFKNIQSSLYKRCNAVLSRLNKKNDFINTVIKTNLNDPLNE